MGQNIYFQEYLSQRQEKLLALIGKITYIERKKLDCFLIIGKIYFFVKSKCYKSKTNILGTLNE